MSSTVQIKRKIQGTGGAAQAAPGGSGKEGELAIWFPGTAGNPDKPTLYASDGGGWREVNPSSNPNVRGIVSAATSGTVEAAFNAQGINVAAGDIVIFTHPQNNGTAYVYTGPTGSPVAGATSAQFTALGAAPQVATGAEVITGTDNIKTVTPSALRGGTAVTPDATPANDANKLVRLGATGKIDFGFLNIDGSSVPIPATFAAFTSGADIGAAYTASGVTAPTGGVFAATFQGSTWLLKDFTAPGTAASWVQITGGSTDTPNAAPAQDAGKFVRLGTNGQIAAGFLPASPTNVRGGLDVTQAFAAATPPYTAGDMVFANADGTVGTGWTGAANKPVKSGDVLLYDGTDWYILPNTTDLTAYLALAGGTMSDGGSITFDTSTGQSGAGAASVTIINGDGGTIDNVVLDNATIDCGTY